MSNNTMDFSIIRASAMQHFSDLVKAFRSYDTCKDYVKLGLIFDLMQRGLLDWVTQGNLHNWLDVTMDDLYRIKRFGFSFNPDTAKLRHSTIESQCHATVALTWAQYPHLKVVTGFTDKTDLHSWLWDEKENTIIECTPIIRDSYFGYVHQDPVRFAHEEFSNIEAMRNSGTIPEKEFVEFSTAIQNRFI